MYSVERKVPPLVFLRGHVGPSTDESLHGETSHPAPGSRKQDSLGHVTRYVCPSGTPVSLTYSVELSGSLSVRVGRNQTTILSGSDPLLVYPVLEKEMGGPKTKVKLKTKKKVCEQFLSKLEID